MRSIGKRSLQTSLMSKRPTDLLIDDMLEAISKIERYRSSGKYSCMIFQP